MHQKQSDEQQRAANYLMKIKLDQLEADTRHIAHIRFDDAQPHLFVKDGSVMKVGDKTVIRANKHLYVSQSDGSYRVVRLPYDDDKQREFCFSFVSYSSINSVCVPFIEGERGDAYLKTALVHLDSFEITVHSDDQKYCCRLFDQLDANIIVMYTNEGMLAFYQLDEGEL